jgi:mycofactocin precursor
MSSVETVESTQTVALEEQAEVEQDLLVEDVSIDGMCGVY